MLGPNKWRLLTIVAGILLAHAIDSPSRSPRILQSQPSAPLGLTIQRVLPWNRDRRSSSTEVRTARNLYTPYKRFSNVDDVRFVERHQGTTDWNWRTTKFGAFRYAPNAVDMRRRSDDHQLAQIALFELVNNTAAAVSGTTIAPVETQAAVRRAKYKYIPLRTNSALPDFAQSDFVQNNVDRSVNLYPSSTDINKVVFPPNVATTSTAIANTATTSSEDIQGRRSGIQFAAHSPNFGSLFIPQSYQEDNPNHPNFQSPYSEELSAGGDNTETRATRGVNYEAPPRTAIAFPPSNTKTFRDDVTKFGDINGPVTSVQRQFSDFLDKQGIRTYENIYYQDEYRNPRHYFPPKSFVEYSEYPGPPRSRLIVPPSWKSSRTPRVVFPQSDGFPSSAGVSNYQSSNDIVFR